MTRLSMFSLLASVLLSACAFGAIPQTPLANPGYVLSGRNGASGFAQNALTSFDAEQMRVYRRVDLPHSDAETLSRDPQGRIWIGFSGSLETSDDRVLVFSAEGNLLKTLHPCVLPNAGITFAARRAFVACGESGFTGKLAVINLETLTVEQTLELKLQKQNSFEGVVDTLIFTASAADEDNIVVAGDTSGPANDPEDVPYSVVTLIDPRTLSVRAQIRLGKSTDIWRILPYQGKFYLLNVGSIHVPRAQANDVLVLTPGTPPTVTPLQVASSPVWGVIQDDILTAYHNPEHNQIITNPHRQISQVNLKTQQVQVWNLPDNWDADDLAIVNGQILLTEWGTPYGDYSHDGLYRFDPTTGKLSLILNVPDASGVLPPR